MFVTPPLAGGEGKRRAFILSFPRLQEWQEATWPLPCADRGNRWPSSGGGRARAPCRHPSAQNGEPTFAANNPCDQRSRPEEALDRCARGADLGHPRKAQGSAAAVTTFTRSHLTRCLSRFGHPGTSLPRVSCFRPSSCVTTVLGHLRPCGTSSAIGCRAPAPAVRGAAIEPPESVNVATIAIMALG
jgi:hypothetical protein